MPRPILFAAFVCGLVGSTSSLWAQGNLDRCNDILRQDLPREVRRHSEGEGVAGPIRVFSCVAWQLRVCRLALPGA